MTAAVIVALSSAVAATAAALASFSALRRARSGSEVLAREIDRGKRAFDEVVGRESAERADALAQTLALARSESLAAFASDERRLIDERRRDVAERERDAAAKLSDALTEAQRTVERRLADWNSDLEKLQDGLAAELERIGVRQQQLMTDVERGIGDEAGQLQTALDEHRGLIAKLRTDFDASAEAVAKAATAELDEQAADRRRALHELSERLRRREREIGELIEREQAEVTARISAQVGEIERHQLEQLRRVVTLESTRFAEGAAQQFDTTIRSAREDAARRLGRELDLAVERFTRETEGVLAERVESEVRAAESRLKDLARRVEELAARALGTGS
ncbi:MAG: hypothetical protein WCH31_05880 [Actinomycetes bacterium]